MSLQDDQNDECPLCLEVFEMDDVNFFPCKCGYQICRFCWHRLLTEEMSLCPNCRDPYTDHPADFKPLSTEELQKIKNEKRQKDQQKKQKISENRKHLANVRVVQKNLVFVVGLPTRLADAETLKKNDYFGKFGKIHKVVVNQSTSYAGSQGPSASAYVTYCKPEDALRAIKTVNNVQLDGRTLKASLGTTKYCSHFLKNQQCPKTVESVSPHKDQDVEEEDVCCTCTTNWDCMYLHELGDEAASFTKEDMQQGKHQEYEKKLQDQILGCNNRKQTASPTPPQNNTNSLKDVWLVQHIKESRANRSKDSTQSLKTEGKNNRSKSKQSSEGQKSKKSKNKTTDSAQHSKHSSKDESASQKKKTTKHKDSTNTSTTTAQSSGHSPVQRLDMCEGDFSLDGNLTDILDLNSKNAQQTTYVQITEQQPQSTKPISANIKIGRCESPVLPPSPISSSSSSLFTPFGSLSSNFLSSSPSPPPSNSLSSFNALSGTTAAREEEASPLPAFVPAAPSATEQNRQPSPSNLFSSVPDSIFSQANYHHTPPPANDNSGLLLNTQLYPEAGADSSEWNYEELQKPEDDLDFDPYVESSKGLKEMLTTESVHKPTYMNETPTPPGFFQPIKPPVPNQSRISVPPPGFCNSMPQNNSLNHMPNVFNPSNTEFLQHCNKIPSARPTMNGVSHFLQEQQQQQQQQIQHLLQQHQQRQLLQQQQQQQQQQQPNSIDILNQFKQQYSREIENSIKRNIELNDRVQNNLFPDSYFNSRNIQKSQNQNRPSWNHQGNGSWLNNEPPVNISESQRQNSFWMKAFQSLSLEENTNQYNGPTPHTNAFPFRGQWSTIQCPPPGFVAPSRSPVNTPFHHMQVNQKI